MISPLPFYKRIPFNDALLSHETTAMDRLVSHTSSISGLNILFGYASRMTSTGGQITLLVHSKEDISGLPQAIRDSLSVPIASSRPNSAYYYEAKVGRVSGESASEKQRFISMLTAQSKKLVQTGQLNDSTGQALPLQGSSIADYLGAHRIHNGLGTSGLENFWIIVLYGTNKAARSVGKPKPQWRSRFASG